MFGTGAMNEEKQRKNIVEIILHPGFVELDGKFTYNDLALLRLEPYPEGSGQANFVNYDETTQPIQISSEVVLPGSIIVFSRFQLRIFIVNIFMEGSQSCFNFKYLAGWGDDEDRETPNQLQKIYLTVAAEPQGDDLQYGSSRKQCLWVKEIAEIGILHVS